MSRLKSNTDKRKSITTWMSLFFSTFAFLFQSTRFIWLKSALLSNKVHSNLASFSLRCKRQGYSTAKGTIPKVASSLIHHVYNKNAHPVPLYMVISFRTTWHDKEYPAFRICNFISNTLVKPWPHICRDFWVELSLDQPHIKLSYYPYKEAHFTL